METTTIKIQELIPSDYNPRYMDTSQKLKLEKNMEKFGLVDPIIINLKNNHIIGGHQRYEILCNKYPDDTQLNLITLGDIGWVFDKDNLEVKDDNHEKAMNLSLNRLDGQFDKTKVGSLLTDLTNAHFDMELSGFEDYEVIEYTLDDFDLQLENKEEDDTNTTQIINDDETSMAKIHFNTPEQRSKFIQWIGRIREKHPQLTITQAIIHELENNINESKMEKVEPYVILLSNKEEKEKYQTLINNIETSPHYQIPPILTMIQND